MQSASPGPVVAIWLTASLCFCHCHSVSLQCFTFSVQSNIGHLYKYSLPSWLWLWMWPWHPLHQSDPRFVNSDSKDWQFLMFMAKYLSLPQKVVAKKHDVRTVAFTFYRLWHLTANMQQLFRDVQKTSPHLSIVQNGSNKNLDGKSVETSATCESPLEIMLTMASL